MSAAMTGVQRFYQLTRTTAQDHKRWLVEGRGPRALIGRAHGNQRRFKNGGRFTEKTRTHGTDKSDNHNNLQTDTMILTGESNS